MLKIFNNCVEMIQFPTHMVDICQHESDEWCSLKGAYYG